MRGGRVPDRRYSFIPKPLKPPQKRIGEALRRITKLGGIFENTG
jgi:hypothetical protein